MTSIPEPKGFEVFRTAGKPELIANGASLTSVKRANPFGGGISIDNVVEQPPGDNEMLDAFVKEAIGRCVTQSDLPRFLKKIYQTQVEENQGRLHWLAENRFGDNLFKLFRHYADSRILAELYGAENENVRMGERDFEELTHQAIPLCTVIDRRLDWLYPGWEHETLENVVTLSSNEKRSWIDGERMVHPENISLYYIITNARNDSGLYRNNNLPRMFYQWNAPEKIEDAEGSIRRLKAALDKEIDAIVGIKTPYQLYLEALQEKRKSLGLEPTPSIIDRMEAGEDPKKFWSNELTELVRQAGGKAVIAGLREEQDRHRRNNFIFESTGDSRVALKEYAMQHANPELLGDAPYIEVAGKKFSIEKNFDIEAFSELFLRAAAQHPIRSLTPRSVAEWLESDNDTGLRVLALLTAAGVVNQEQKAPVKPGMKQITDGKTGLQK